MFGNTNDSMLFTVNVVPPALVFVWVVLLLS